MDFDKQIFMIGASFTGEEESVDVNGLSFGEDIRRDIGNQLAEQFSTFSELEKVKYNGRYKADDDECLCIEDYKDPGKTINNFLKLCDGTRSEYLKWVEDLENCRALLFHMPECPGLVLIQRFTKALVALKGRFYSFSDSDSFTRLDRSSFCFGTSLAGYYSIEENKLYFKNVQTIRSAIPGFDEMYAPGADEQMIESFFSNPRFDSDSARIIANKESKKIPRLVWLINNEGIDIDSKLHDIKKFDALLNIKCYRDGQVFFPSDVNRSVIILRIILGDVYESDGKVYLSNSRKALNRFED